MSYKRFFNQAKLFWFLTFIKYYICDKLDETL